MRIFKKVQKNAAAVIFLTASLLPTDLFSQQVDKMLSIGVDLNSYGGDLSKSWKSFTPGIHAALKLNNHEKFNSRFEIGYSVFTGQNPDYKFTDPDNPESVPVQYFKTTSFLLRYEMQYHIVKRKQFWLWVSQGAGVMGFTPKDEFKNKLKDQSLTRASGETYSGFTLILPTSIGGAYFLKNDYGIGMDVGWLNPLTDYIDNISQLSNRKGPDLIWTVGFSIYAPLTRKSENTMTRRPKQKKVQETDVGSDKITDKQPDSVREKIPKIEITETPGYYLIAASYKSYEKAIRYMYKLENKGYMAGILFDEKTKKYLVFPDQSADETGAEIRKKELLRRSFFNTIWIYMISGKE